MCGFGEETVGMGEKKNFLPSHPLPKRHMMCADVSFTGLLCIIVSSVTFFPWPSPFFILM
jgi:hypothetical protein